MRNNAISACLVACALGFTCTSFSAQAETVSEAILKCKAEQNSLQRLLCFDKVAENISGLKDQSFSDAQASAPPADAVLPTTSKGQRQPRDDFGKTPVDETPDALSSRVTKVKKDTLKRQTVTLQNGQVWREIGSSGHIVKSGQQVTIEKGLFGSYYLSVDGSNREMQVKRIK